MPKQKRHSGAKKRFKLTGSGKLLRRKAMQSHYLSKKSAKRKRSFRRDHDVHGADRRGVKRLLGGGN